MIRIQREEIVTTSECPFDLIAELEEDDNTDAMLALGDPNAQTRAELAELLEDELRLTVLAERLAEPHRERIAKIERDKATETAKLLRKIRQLLPDAAWEGLR